MGGCTPSKEQYCEDNTRIAERDKNRIELLRDLGWNLKDISEYTGFSISAASRILAGVSRASKNPGEIKSPIFRKHRTLLESMFLSSPYSSAEQLAVDFKRLAKGEVVSSRQISRWRLALGF